MRRLLALVAVLVVWPASASAAGINVFIGSLTIPSIGQVCDRSATTATFATQVAAATAGQTLCLASGSYGTWNGVAKSSPGVTITPITGATATMALNFRNDNTPKPAWLTLDGLTITTADIASPTHDLTIKNSAFTGSLYFYVGGAGHNSFCSSCAEMQNANILLDHNTHNNIDPGTFEGRIDFVDCGPACNTAVGVTIQNSTFDGGLADGIQDGAYGVRILNNTFKNIQDCGCGPHTDSLQIFGGQNATITGNYFTNVTDTIVQFDGGGGHTITNNVMTNVTGNPWGITLGGDSNSVIEHNTMAGLEINMTSKAGQNSLGATIRNNVASSVVLVDSDSTAVPTVNNYNLCSGGCVGANSITGSPTFSGGATPTTYPGFALAPSSLGYLGGSDGMSIGVVP